MSLIFNRSAQWKPGLQTFAEVERDVMKSTLHHYIWQIEQSFVNSQAHFPNLITKNPDMQEGKKTSNISIIQVSFNDTQS